MSTSLRGTTDVSSLASRRDDRRRSHGTASPSNSEAGTSHAAAIFAQQQQYIFDCVRPLYDEPLAIAEGSGCRVTDYDGREYLDAFAGILTTSLGHCHPAVVAAVQEQAARVGHLSTLYVNDRQVEAARALAEISPGDLGRTFFLNSGTEAIETALATARLHTGRTEIIALRQAYHGRTSMAAAITAHAPWRVLPGTVTGITHALSPYAYRAPFGDASDEELVEIYARDLIEVIETTTNGRPAAFIAETIQGVGGYIVPPKGYFQRMAGIIRSYGGLFIADEVQSGFGRTGTHWFGIEHWDVVPDITVMAKGIAGGMPVGAVTTTSEIAGSWRGKTISTFGGNPVCMAAMVATLGVMRAEDVRTRARDRGAQLRAALDRLGARYPWIGEVRGMGLMQAIELVEDPATKEPSPRLAGKLLHAARDEGLLIGIGGLHGHVIRLGPSLLIEEDEMDEVTARLGRACATVAAGR
ncbi:MAG: aspartate aminotransferase family protein [Gemmatimonadetes bacterium]|nr:aspartate aminotransferase family protein [Gemmatimonadota bacterium]MYB98406.1 aspartate aminotransferase family protein [Gemmatimonadota bacterium]MYI47417.1 aspartate aminotransferase family protein [Gemmatimonadota bacterium]